MSPVTSHVTSPAASTSRARRPWRAAAVAAASAVVLSGCSFSPYELPLPGGADVGDDPFEVTVAFRDVLDLVPQSAVRVNDIAVGKVTKVRLDGWTATVTLEVNKDVDLPDNAEASIRQTSILGEKFVSLQPPAEGASGRLGNGDKIPLERSGRNPEIEEVLGAASLLFNGGGLEKTNTIVRELNAALGGNEPEVKELLRSTTDFIGQLDDNKADLLTALEKVDNLARATQEQEGAITQALDELPEALDVLDQQRDDLVGLLQSLDRLGDVATDVIRRTKDDTLAVLRDLEPTLRQLANAGDDLAKAVQLIFTFPFSDAIGSNSVAAASYPCTAYNPDVPASQNAAQLREDVQRGACYGDYIDLDINLSLTLEQAQNLLLGIFSIGDRLPEIIGAAAGGDEAAAEEGAGGEDLAGAVSQLVELQPGLTGLGDGAEASDEGASGQTAPRASASSQGSGSQGSGTPTLGGSGSGLCTLLGSCRVTTTSELMAAQTEDLSRLVLAPVVAR